VQVQEIEGQEIQVPDDFVESDVDENEAVANAGPSMPKQSFEAGSWFEKQELIDKLEKLKDKGFDGPDVPAVEDLAEIADEEEVKDEIQDDPTDITAEKLLNEVNRIRLNSA
jgi:hypothetical protein